MGMQVSEKGAQNVGGVDPAEELRRRRGLDIARVRAVQAALAQVLQVGRDDKRGGQDALGLERLWVDGAGRKGKRGRWERGGRERGWG